MFEWLDWGKPDPQEEVDGRMAMFLSKQRTLERIVLPGGRRLLYGVGLMMCGLLVGLFGPPSVSERPPRPHPENIWFYGAGCVLFLIGVLLLSSFFCSRWGRPRESDK
jgi:hypothetical protein